MILKFKFWHNLYFVHRRDAKDAGIDDFPFALSMSGQRETFQQLRCKG
jgi:hypothetical protein